MGQAKLFNTMILGGYLKVRPVVEMENVMVGLKKSLPERAWKMLPANEEAIHHGGEIIRKVRDDPGSDGFPKDGRPEGRRFLLARKVSASVPSVRLVVFPLGVFDLVFCFLFLVPSARPFCLSAVFFRHSLPPVG